MRPLLSIIVPVYGTEDSLERCLLSIETSASDDLEVIVVCDGGDESRCSRICEQVANERDISINLVAHPVNRGLLAARLTGLRTCGGKYVMHLDSDDSLNPGLLAQIREGVCEGDCDFRACFFNVIEVINGETRARGFGLERSPANVTAEEILPRIISSNGNDWIWFVAWNKVWDREFLLSSIAGLRLPDHLVMLEDFYLSVWVLRSMSVQDNILVLEDTPGINYFRHDDSVTRKRKNLSSVGKNLTDTIFVIRALRSSMNQSMRQDFDPVFFNLFKKNVPHPRLITDNPFIYFSLLLRACFLLPKYFFALCRQFLQFPASGDSK